MSISLDRYTVFCVVQAPSTQVALSISTRTPRHIPKAVSILSIMGNSVVCLSNIHTHPTFVKRVCCFYIFMYQCVFLPVFVRHEAALRRSNRQYMSGEDHQPGEANRDLQPGRSESRQGIVSTHLSL